MNAMFGLYMIITILAFAFVGNKIRSMELRFEAIEKSRHTTN
jgi:hypothetical protein